MRRAIARAMAGFMVICGATGVASGQAVILSDGKLASASSSQADKDGNPVGTPQFMNVDGLPGLDFSGGAATKYNDLGFIATASGSWNHAYGPSNPGLGNAFTAAYMSGSTASESTSEGLWSDHNAGGACATLITFSVASDTAWSFGADIEGTTFGASLAAYSFSLANEDFSIIYGDAFKFATGGESINDSLSLGGTIPAGNYFFSLSIFTGEDYQFTPGSGNAAITLTNGVFAIPSPGVGVLIAIGGLLTARRRR